MKKTKILAVLGILLAMGLTACQPADNGGQSQAAPESQQSGGESQEHKHSFGDWVQTKAPTCTEKGEEEQVCECGEKKTRAVNALGHDWGEWAAKTAASCTTDGVDERVCKRCGAKEERAVKAAHDWDAEQEIAAGGEDQVAYKLATCKKGDAIKAEVKATDAKFYKGKIKSGTPEGYFKLSSTNDKAYWKFTVAGTKMYKGMLYQRGAMDSFSGNTERTYAQTSTSGDHAPKYPLGNFDVKVNGDQLDKSQWIDVPYSELLAEGEDSAAMGDNYSPICLVPIGECVIQAGVNEITYERLGSYNLIISELVFIGAEYEHVHAAAEQWSSNDEQHWHACTALGCPTGKLDVASHTFGDWETTKEATCKEAGERQHACTVCGKVVKEAVEKLAHTLGEPHDVVAATCEAAGSQKRTCSVCNEVVTEVLPKADHKFGDAVENYAAGEGYIAMTGHNCSVCNKSALRWSAQNFDATESSTDLDVKTDYIRFADGGKVENKGQTEVAGSHIVYKVNVAAAQEKAGLAFKITNTGGNSGVADVFGPIPNDSAVGYVKQADGTFVESTHRYGLKVNGVEYSLGDNNYGNQANATGWFEWPVEFPLVAGVNTIDVFAYRGYRAKMMEFELTGLPHITPSHVHNGDAEWLTDATNHWHKCTADGCPIADGIYEKAEHTWGEKYDEVPATCSAKGSYKQKCTVCEFVKTVETDKAEHTWVAGDVTVDGVKGSQTLTCSVCGETKTITGAIYGTAKWSEALSNGAALSSGKFASGTTYEFTFFNVPADGTYVFTLNLKGSSGNGSKVLNGSGQGFEVKANGEAATFLGDQKTYEEFLGADQTVWVDVAFAEVNLKAGTNVISIKATTGYYRISANTDGNVSLAPKA